MSTLAPHSTHEEIAFDCRATAALLRSLGTLVWASHVGAVVSASYHTWIPLVAWGVVLYLGVRVRLDAELLELLASAPDQAPGRLDRWLLRANLRRSTTPDRDIVDRCQGSRRLARNLVMALVAQMAALAVIILRESA